MAVWDQDGLLRQKRIVGIPFGAAAVEAFRLRFVQRRVLTEAFHQIRLAM